MKKRESSVIYEVSAIFGSEFQKDAAERFLRGVIQAWADFYAKKHKKNKIVIEQKRMNMNPTCKGPQGVC